jgi:Zn-dependent peptidase ImmA (M78 family)
MKEKKFNGNRLKEALQYRATTMAELSRKTGISRQSLSLYANGANVPPFDNVKAISKELGFPYEYFMTEDSFKTVTNNTFFRSQAAAKKKDQRAQRIKMEMTARLYEVFLNDYVDFPALDLPSTVKFRNLVPDPLTVEADSIMQEIEDLADEVRNYWELGDGPIENFQYVLESHGIIVSGYRDVDTKIDAFSQKLFVNGTDEVFLIVLALGDKPKERLLFDMAHELGHILMHDWDENNENLSREEFNNQEREANMFASALLLPRNQFKADITPYATNIDFYKTLKKKWGVSMQAMMYRTRQLDIITANQFSYMMRVISSKGWRTHEPGDVPGDLNSTIFQGAIDVLFNGNYVNAAQLIDDFHNHGVFLSQKDMEELMGLQLGTLDTHDKVIEFVPKVKTTK